MTAAISSLYQIPKNPWPQPCLNQHRHQGQHHLLDVYDPSSSPFCISSASLPSNKMHRGITHHHLPSVTMQLCYTTYAHCTDKPCCSVHSNKFLFSCQRKDRLRDTCYVFASNLLWICYSTALSVYHIWIAGGDSPKTEGSHAPFRIFIIPWVATAQYSLQSGYQTQQYLAYDCLWYSHVCAEKGR